MNESKAWKDCNILNKLNESYYIDKKEIFEDFGNRVLKDHPDWTFDFHDTSESCYILFKGSSSWVMKYNYPKVWDDLFFEKYYKDLKELKNKLINLDEKDAIDNFYVDAHNDTGYEIIVGFDKKTPMRIKRELFDCDGKYRKNLINGFYDVIIKMKNRMKEKYLEDFYVIYNNIDKKIELIGNRDFCYKYNGMYSDLYVKVDTDYNTMKICNKINGKNEKTIKNFNIIEDSKIHSILSDYIPEGYNY